MIGTVPYLIEITMYSMSLALLIHDEYFYTTSPLNFFYHLICFLQGLCCCDSEGAGELERSVKYPAIPNFN